MPTAAKTYFELMQWGPNGWLDEMVFATGLTLIIALTGFLFGLLFGGMAAAGRMSGHPFFERASIAYTTILRGVPDLLVIYLFYFGGSGIVTAIGHMLGYDGFIGVPGFVAGTIAIGLVSGAYQSEVIRGSFLAVPSGQVEAARAFGMSGVTLVRRIVGPQVLRYAVPGLGNVWQLALKEAALVAVVGLAVHWSGIKIGDVVLIHETRFSDLLRQAHIAAGSTRQPFPFYITCAAFYLALTTLSTWFFRRAEAWATRGMKRG